MKSKNLIIALVAVVFAVGSAFSSVNTTLVDAYARVILNNGDDPICVKTDQKCDIDGGAQCWVTIAVSKPGVGSRTVRGRNASCAVLPNSSDTPMSAVLVPAQTPYDATDN